MVKNFQLFITVLAVPFLVSAQDINQLFNTCTNSFRADPNAVQQIISNPYYSTSDQTLHCVVQCVGQLAGVLDTNGRLIPGCIPPSGIFDVNRAQQAVNQCSQLMGSNTCHTGYLQWQCLMQLAGRSYVGGQQPNYGSIYGSQTGYVLNQFPYYSNNLNYGYNSATVPPAGGSIQFPGNYFTG